MSYGSRAGASRSSGTRSPASRTSPRVRGRGATPGVAAVRLAIVAAEFNREVTDVMVKKALTRAEERGIRVTSVVRVPGVFEIPLAVERLLERADVDAAVAIGAVIKGETLHDEALMRSEEHTLNSSHRTISYAVCCLK